MKFVILFDGSPNVFLEYRESRKLNLLTTHLHQVDAASEPSGYIPLHLACITGHVGVVGLLLSRSTELLKVTDNAGRTCLHVAAASGHYDMVQVLTHAARNVTTNNPLLSSPGSDWSRSGPHHS